jgi:hypothetical protein
VLSAIQKDKTFARYFKINHYELNPVWQKDISEKKWFNPRHIILTCFVSGSLYIFLEKLGLNFLLAKFILGMILITFGMVVGRHITNLLTFWFLNKNPDEISGEIKMSHRYLLNNSLFQIITVAIPVMIGAIYSQSAFVAGGALGLLLFIITHLIWIRIEREKASSNNSSSESTKPKSLARRLKSYLVFALAYLALVFLLTLILLFSGFDAKEFFFSIFQP